MVIMLFIFTFAVEIDKHAASTYEMNFGPHSVIEDLNNISHYG